MTYIPRISRVPEIMKKYPFAVTTNYQTVATQMESGEFKAWCHDNNYKRAVFDTTDGDFIFWTRRVFFFKDQNKAMIFKLRFG